MIKDYQDRELDFQHLQFLDEQDLVAIPALTDIHVHFRTPGHEYKEDWVSGAKAALAGGVTFVADMPNNDPACCFLEAFTAKKQRIESQLQSTQLPLKYGLYFGAAKGCLDQLALVADKVLGLKIFMGSSTGNLLVDDDENLHIAFREAAKFNLPVLIHAEDEAMIAINKQTLANASASDHSRIRNEEVAQKAVARAITFAKEYNVRLHLLHISTEKELQYIEDAKAKGIQVTAEATPHHLFFSTEDYASYGTRLLVNPPVRKPSDVQALWKALNNGLIDTIGTDHAPHLLKEKDQPYGKAPSGLPSIEVYLALFLNAVAQGKLSLKRLVELVSMNPRKVLGLPPTQDWVLIDPNCQEKITQEKIITKSAWSPYEGWELKGWPKYVLVSGYIYDCQTLAGLASYEVSV